MNIHITEHASLEETEIIIRCRQIDDEIMRICAGLRAFDRKITGTQDNETFVLNTTDILYAETVDRKTFLYTTDGIYETPLRLYELEERLAGDDFLRATKSCLFNFSKVKSLRADFGGRILCTLENGELITVSRQYAAVIKEKLNPKRKV